MHKLVFGYCVRRSIVSAKLEGYIFGCYLVFIDVVSIIFVYTDMAVIFAAKLSSESFERIIKAEFEIEDFDVGK